ncbi:MAG TPA: hypothetical protein VGB54_06360 [Allosphingosinicella sp.]|jgi:hypothetical protein
MNKRALLAAGLLLGLTACSRGGGGNESDNAANIAAQEGLDPNMMIGGDEISPIPEAEDDMAANANAGGNVAGNAAGAARPYTQPPPVPIPAPPPRPR